MHIYLGLEYIRTGELEADSAADYRGVVPDSCQVFHVGLKTGRHGCSKVYLELVFVGAIFFVRVKMMKTARNCY